MKKGEIEFEKEAGFVKKKWRNKGQFRTPSAPKHTFIYKEKSLYERIQEQNSKENVFFEESKIRISSNLQKFKGKNSVESSENKEKFKGFRFVRRNLHLEKAISFENRSFEEKEENIRETKPKSEIYCKKLQNLNKEVMKADELEKKLKKKRFFRRNNVSAIIQEKRKEEEFKIQEILEKIKIKHKRNENFHAEIREKFNKFKQSRVEIDEAFAILKEKNQFRNYGLIKKLENLFKSGKNCEHSSENSKNFKGDFLFEKQDDKKNSIEKNSLSTEFFMRIRMQKLDSQKIRLFLNFEDSEINFVMGERSENYVKIDIKNEELLYYGNDLHDQKLLFDLEKKMIEDLKKQNAKNEAFFKENGEINMVKTPSFSQGKRRIILKKEGLIEEKSCDFSPNYKEKGSFAENSKKISDFSPKREVFLYNEVNSEEKPSFSIENPKNFDPRNAFRIFLSIKRDIESRKLDISCEKCEEFNDLLTNFIYEVYKLDSSADSSNQNCDEILESFLAKEDSICFLDNFLMKFGFEYRKCLANCYEILPNHAIFFEKFFEILLFFNERISVKFEESFALLKSDFEQ